MKQEEAKKLIRAEYQIWKVQQENITAQSKFIFFGHLQMNKPHLLKFRYSGSDQWQTVNSMLSGL
jgi:hypothetical protein